MRHQPSNQNPPKWPNPGWLRGDNALRAAGIIAIGTAVYHGVAGDAMLRKIEMSAADMRLVTSTFQIGTMGWLCGGVLLIGAGGMPSAQARNWIVAVTVPLFGLPGLGTLTLTGGKPSIGGIALVAAAALALVGRRPAEDQLDGGDQPAPNVGHHVLDLGADGRAHHQVKA